MDVKADERFFADWCNPKLSRLEDEKYSKARPTVTMESAF
jgi:hypothetical protein